MGSQLRDYPRLLHGGRHLADPIRDRGRDIAGRASAGLGVAVVLWSLLVVVVTAVRARRHAQRWWPMLVDLANGGGSVPWRAILAALAVLLALICVGASLAPHYHVLGTDKTGNDVLYQAVKSIRTGLLIGTLTTLVMLPFALILGVTAGYFRGWVDDVIQ